MDSLKTNRTQLPTVNRGVLATVNVPITQEPIELNPGSTQISTNITQRPLLEMPALDRGVIATVNIPIEQDRVELSTDSSKISTEITPRQLEKVPSYAEMLELCKPGKTEEVKAQEEKKREYPMTTVTVDKRDSVWGLLTEQGWSVNEILSQGLVKVVVDANSLKDANHIEAGQTLKVPGKAGKSKKPGTQQKRSNVVSGKIPNRTTVRTQPQTSNRVPVNTPQTRQTIPQTTGQTPNWGGFGGGGDFNGGGAGSSW